MSGSPPEGRRLMRIARDEAARLGRDAIGTEHVLLALLHPEGGRAAEALSALRVERELLVHRLSYARATSSGYVDTQMIFEQEVKEALERSLQEARKLGDPQFDPIHLLLGLVDDDRSAAARVLREVGVTADDVRTEVARRRRAP